MKNMKYYRPTWAEVNLNNLEYNFRQIKRLVSPKTKILVTVKADAYGHGLIPVAKRLRQSGVDFLGVASIDEGIKLREAGLRLPILILGLILKSDCKPVFAYDLTPTVCDKELAVALNNTAKTLSRQIKVHVKIDTGMGRIGVLHHEAKQLIEDIRKLKYIDIEGLFTHFALADTSRDFTRHQIDLFDRLVSDLEKEGIDIPLKHAANSMGAIGYKMSHFNMVRPGLVIYGLYPRQSLNIKLKPVLSLMTKVMFIKRMPKGSGVSYGHEYVTGIDTRIAVLPIGYGDGYPRNLSNKGPVLIRGKRFKIAGRICMDQIMVDVGASVVKPGDKVMLIGSQKKNKITTEELAELSGTISYEIVCGLGSRIPRVYV